MPCLSVGPVESGITWFLACHLTLSGCGMLHAPLPIVVETLPESFYFLGRETYLNLDGCSIVFSEFIVNPKHWKRCIRPDA